MSRRQSLGVAALAVLCALAWGARPPPRPAPAVGGLFGGSAVVAWSPGYRVSFFGLEHLHPIQLDKADKAAQSLRDRDLVPAEGFLVPGEVSDADLLRVHSAEHLARLEDPVALGSALELALPAWVPSSVLRRRVLGPFRRQTQGTVEAARGALGTGLGINLGGGFHHARPGLAHGFCVYADVAVAVAVLREEGVSGHILIVDTDAHQGDGNHSAFAGDPTVTSVSLHQQGLFPQPGVPGDADLELPAGTSDAAYRAELQGVLADVP